MLADAYGCVVENRFGNLLDDDADPFDLICVVEHEKEKKKKKMKKKQNEEKKVMQKKPGQKESQRDRRLPAVHQDPVPGELSGFGLSIPAVSAAGGDRSALFCCQNEVETAQSCVDF